MPDRENEQQEGIHRDRPAQGPACARVDRLGDVKIPDKADAVDRCAPGNDVARNSIRKNKQSSHVSTPFFEIQRLGTDETILLARSAAMSPGYCCCHANLDNHREAFIPDWISSWVSGSKSPSIKAPAAGENPRSLCFQSTVSRSLPCLIAS